MAANVETGMLADLLDLAVLTLEALTSRRPRLWLLLLLVIVVGVVVLVMTTR